MSEISILDLQNLRHLIGGFETSQCKMQDYASCATDPEVKKIISGCCFISNEEQTRTYEILIGGQKRYVRRKDNGGRCTGRRER